MLKWFLIVVAITLVVAFARCFLVNAEGKERSMYPDQDKYEATDGPSSTVVVASGPNVSDISYSVNSTNHFLWTIDYDDDPKVKPADRWFGINHIVAGDIIYFQIRTKVGKRVESKVIINSVALTPVRIRVDDTGQATFTK
jgi:hypothetical protein